MKEENEERKLSSLFSDYYVNDQSMKKKKEPAEPPKSQTMIKEGNWTEGQKTLIKDTIEKAQQFHPKNLEKQLQYIHFHLEEQLGKRIQIFGFDKTAIEGHCLFAVNGLYMEIQA